MRFKQFLADAHERQGEFHDAPESEEDIMYALDIPDLSKDNVVRGLLKQFKSAKKLDDALHVMHIISALISTGHDYPEEFKALEKSMRTGFPDLNMYFDE